MSLKDGVSAGVRRCQQRVRGGNSIRMWTILFLFLWATSLRSLGEVSQIPIEHFFNNPQFSGVSLSPDGKFLVFISPYRQDRNSLGFIELASKEGPVVLYPEVGSDYGNYSWLNNEEVIYAETVRNNRYVGGLLKTHRSTMKSHTLADGQVAIRVVNPLIDDTEHAWVWVLDSTDRTRPGLRKIHTESSEDFRERVRVSIPAPEKETFGWWFDWNDEPRLVLCVREKRQVYLHRWNEDDDWKSIPLDPEEWRVWAFGENNKELIVSGYGSFDTEGLYFFDLQEETVSECHFRDERYDFGRTARLAFYQPTGRLLGIRYERSGPTMAWFDPKMRAIQELLDQRIPGAANVVTDWNTELTRFLTISYSDRDPGTYYLLDVESQTFSKLFPGRPWIKHDQLAEMQILRLKATEGLVMEGYLTEPRSGKRPFPAVVLVHGGPHLRDRFGFNGEVQFLANRGYAVVQINYRGSSGFGRKYSETYQYAFRDMIEDITYGTRTLMDKGLIDGKRTAIMGGSFGAYAALSAACFEPSLYKCAVSFAGVFDWAELIKHRKRNRLMYQFQTLSDELGDPKYGREQFESISPIYHIDKIEIPVFVAHGGSDRNVSVRQSKDLVRELKRHGIPHEKFFKSGEGHSFHDPKSRIELYNRVEGFLKKHLYTRCHK